MSDDTINFLKTLTHQVLRAITRKFNLRVAIKGYSKLTHDELVNKLSEHVKYVNGKLSIIIPEDDIEIPQKKRKVYKKRTPRAKEPSVDSVELSNAPEINENLTAKLASFINTLSADNTITENEKVDTKQELITNAITDIQHIGKQTNLDLNEKKDKILTVLTDLEEDKPFIDLSILSQDKKNVDSNLDDGLANFTKNLFESFYADEMLALDGLNFDFGNSDISPAQITTNNKHHIVSADVDEDTGVITVFEEDNTEIIDITQNIEKHKTSSLPVIIEDESEPVTKPLKNYIDELNDELAKLETLSFNYGQPDIVIPDMTISNIQPEVIEPVTHSEPVQQDAKIRSEINNTNIDNPKEWVRDNLHSNLTFKTPNEKYKWTYYPIDEINLITDEGVLDYIKNNTVNFKGLSKEHSKQVKYYIQAQLNSIIDQQKRLVKNRSVGRPQKGQQAEDINTARDNKIMAAFDNLPNKEKEEFNTIIKKIDHDTLKMLKDYAREEAFDNSYKPFDDDWEETQFYSDLTDKYYFNTDIGDILEQNDISKSVFSSWIVLHIQRKNMLSELNRLIMREEKIRKHDTKLMQKSATKIQGAVRGFLTRRKLAKNPIEKPTNVMQKEQSIKDAYTTAINSGLPTKEILSSYLELAKTNIKQIYTDIDKYFTDNKISMKAQNTLLKKLTKSLTQIRAEKEKELYDVEFSRKEFQYWKDLILKQTYSSSGQQAKFYELKKQYKKTDDETKQTEILEKFAMAWNQQKVNKLLTNYNLPE